MKSLEIRLNVVLGCLLTVLTARAWADESSSAAQFLPKTTVIYAELRDPIGFVMNVQDERFAPRILRLRGIKQAMESKQFLEFRAAVAIVEARLGRTWPKIVQTAATRGVTLAIDGKTEGIALLVHAGDAETLPNLVNALVALVRADATSKGNADPVREDTYRGCRVYQVGDARLGTFSDWLVMTNKPELGKAILDQHLDQDGESLAARTDFQAQLAASAGTKTGWAYVDLATLRAAGVAPGLYTGRAENIVGEVLLGGILGTLKETSQLTAALDWTADSITLELATPYDPAWMGEERQHFFGPDSEGIAPKPIHLDNEILSLSAYRNLTQMWLHSGDLFDEKHVDELAKADSTLTTLFGGRNFGEDILGALHPEIQFVVARQMFAPNDPQPKLKLPSFALIGRLRDTETMRPNLRRTFQSLVGFLNVIGANEGQPQLDLDIQRPSGVEIVSASYLVDSNQSETEQLPINFNFSPTILFMNDYFALSSTRNLARDLIQSIRDQSEPEADNPQPRLNTAVTATTSSVLKSLEDNREQLIAQNMVSEGHSRDEAERDIADLFDLLPLLSGAELVLNQPVDRLTLRLTLRLATAGESAESAK